MTMYPNSSRWPALRRFGAIGIAAKSLPLDQFIVEVSRLGTLTKPADDGDPSARVPEPTNRHLQILTGMARGLQTKQIAKECDLSESRTSELIGEILDLTGAGNWAEAVVHAIEHGWIEPRVPPPPWLNTTDVQRDHASRVIRVHPAGLSI